MEKSVSSQKLGPGLVILILPVLLAILLLQIILFGLQHAQKNGLIGITMAWGGYNEKLKTFAKNKNHFDAIFLGSSASRHIPMNDFDDQLKKMGLEISSFNFSREFTYYEEILELSQAIKELAPSKLKWIFFDTATLSGVAFQSKYGDVQKNDRTIGWHGFSNTVLLTRNIWNKDISIFVKIVATAKHWEMFLLKQVTPRFTASYKIFASEGQSKFEATEKCEDAILENISEEEFNEKVKTLPNSCTEKYFDPYTNLMFEKIVKVFRSINPDIRFIPYRPPTLRQNNQCEIQTSNERFPILYFHSNRFPNLFRYEDRENAEHLNCAGSRLFAATLANELAPIIMKPSRP